MEIIPITIEEFADLHKAMENIRQQYVNTTLVAYSGSHPAIGEITITSDPLQCLLFISKAAQIKNDAVLSCAA